MSLPPPPPRNFEKTKRKLNLLWNCNRTLWFVRWFGNMNSFKLQGNVYSNKNFTILTKIHTSGLSGRGVWKVCFFESVLYSILELIHMNIIIKNIGKIINKLGKMLKNGYLTVRLTVRVDPPPLTVSYL